jgi:class 3 adenylate cyclase/CHASE2 domain-containing sensor protein
VTERRSIDVSVALLLAAAALWLGRDPVALGAAARLPGFGFPLVSLLLQAFTLMLAAAGLYRLRGRLLALGGWLLARLDAAELRLNQLPRARALAVRAVTIGLLVAATVVALVDWARFDSDLETRVVDLFFRLRFPERSQAELVTGQQLPSARRQDDVVIVALDDETIAHLGWPLPRKHYAQLIDVVAANQPQSLAFDVALVDPSRDRPEWDAAIGEAAHRARAVTFTFTVARITGESRPQLSSGGLKALDANSIPWHASAAGLPEYSELVGGDAAPQPVIDAVAHGGGALAMANVLLDNGDDVLRHSLVVARLRQRLLPSLSLRLAADALNVPLEQVRVYPGSHVDLGGKRRIPIDAMGRTLVRYQGRHQAQGEGPFRYLSLWSLLRSDTTVTLAGNPLGEDQRFRLDGTTRLSGGEARLEQGMAVRGVARYSPDPGQLLEVEVGGAAPAEPEFEMLDESTFRFATTVASAKENRGDLAALKGKHVLLGSTALAAADLRNSPLGELPAVEHHATMLANILHDDFFEAAPRWSDALLVVAAALIASAIGVTATAGVGLLLTALLVLSLLTGAYLSSASGLYVPVVGPSAAVASAYLLCLVLGARATRNAQARAEKDREFVRQTFGRYLTEQVVQKLLDSPDGLRLGGQREFVTIMMTDLRGFTSMCGTMEPENVVRLLNHYLEEMTRTIELYGGTIDEFIGDAILVVFGAPLKLERAEARAVACAISMLNAMPEINRWNKEHGLPEVEMGIGVHSGEVVLGNIGSELRAKYGIVGSTINLTSRVESYTVGGQVLISEATRERCAELLTLGTTQTVSPKGVKGSLTIHEVLAVGSPFEVKLQSANEQLSPPAVPLELGYAVMKEKAAGELSQRAKVVAISELGLELEVKEELPVLSNLKLAVVGPAGLTPGDLYGKVMRVNVRPGVLYLRLTSVAPEAKPALDAARGGAAPAAPPVPESALVST